GSITTANQILLDRRHRAAHAIRIGPAGNHGPRLRDRIDTTLFIPRRTQRRAVIEVGATIPVAVPRFVFQRLAQVVELFAITIATHLLFARVDVRREGRQGHVKKPTKPNALALATDADAVHAV